MRTWMLALIGATLLAGPAEARRFRFFGFGGGGGGAAETITLVENLPDRDPYVRDGDTWDVGWLDSFTKKDGYVLYHGDAYVRLDAESLALLKEELGHDPTAKHRAAAAAAREAKADTSPNAVERRPGETNEALAERVRREVADRNAGAPAAARLGGGGFAGRMLLALLIGGIGIFAVLKMARAAFKPSAREAAVDEAPGPEPADTGSFDQRVARRLAELNGGSPEPAAAMPAGVRTFGRRGG